MPKNEYIDYKQLLEKIYSLISANEYVLINNLYYETIELGSLTKVQKEYILNKTNAFLYYWYNNIFRCPRQWKKLNNNIKCMPRSLVLISSTLQYIDNNEEKSYYKKYLKRTLDHNRKRISDHMYTNIIETLSKPAGVKN